MPRTRSAAPMVCALAAALAVCAAPAHAQLVTLETKDLRLIYAEPSQSYLAPHVARCFENSLRFESRLFGYTPSEKVTVLLRDFSDRGNASAATVPRNSVAVDIAPFSFAFETMLGNERINTIMNHELVHVSVQDQAAPADRFFRGLFRGKVLPISDHPETLLYFYLTAPRTAAPSWYQEGIAVFLDTWMAGGLGRAQGAWDEMVFRSKVLDGSHIYDPLGLASEGTKTDFQVGVNSYLYGTRFMSYLAHENSPESVVRWVSRGEGTRGYFAFQFSKVFGVPLDEAWREWIRFEREFQRKNIEAIRAYPVTPCADISGQALGSVSRAWYDEQAGRIYAGVNYPGIVAHLSAISVADGSVEKITDIKQPVLYSVTSTAWDPSTRTLFYTTDNREERDLRAIDPDSGDSRTLLKDARIGDLAFNHADRSLWGVRHYNGIATLAQIPHPWTSWKQVHSWPYGEIPYDIDVSPDGTLLSGSFAEISGRQSLRIWTIASLLAGDAAPLAEVDFSSTIPSTFAFSPDGRYLYGSAYTTGVSNIFRYEIATGALEAVSNTETGLFRPIPLADGSLIVFRYTGEGFVPARMEARPLQDVSAITFLGQQVAEKHPVVRDWNAGSPAEIPIEDLVVRREPYRAVPSLRLESVYPVIEGYKDFAAYGVHANFSDPLGLNAGSLTATLTPYELRRSDERLHVQLKYRHRGFRFGFKHNDADFYDLFGPTKTSRRGYSFSTGFDKTFINDAPRRMDLSLDASYHGKLERLPDYQNVEATFGELFNARIRLGYRHLRSSLGSVDDEKGIKWELVTAGSYVNGRAIPRLHGTFDVGFGLPLRHSSVWLRSAAGSAFGDPDDPFANFFFGGFGNNHVDSGDEKRYRLYYAFPGVELNELGGREFVKSQVEWNLPPIRFRRLGSPGFYATWARPAIFAGGIATNPLERTRNESTGNAGAQVDFRLTVLSRFDMTLSFGYAVASESVREGRRGREIMYSLKILQ